MIIFYAMVLLGVLIFIHELGHFLVAKRLGVKVLKFSLGFGHKIVGRKYGETEYQISAVPLGGYVKMLGEEPGEELQDSEKARAYSQQPVWKRFAIVFSGPLFNILFATVIFFFIFLIGIPHLLPVIGSIGENTPASIAGLVKGDRIVKIDGIEIKNWEDMTSIIHNQPCKKLRLEVKRGDKLFEYTIIPEKKVVKDMFGQDKEIGLIGITPSGESEVRKEGLLGAVRTAIVKTWDISVLTLLSVVKLIQRIIPAETIGGPILIFQMAGQQASQGALNFFSFMAIISINLGILNLLPIPVLDGGHIFFLGIEAMRRKPLSEKFIMVAQRVGLALILTLMAFAVYNDIMRLITGKMMP